ncbi:MAG TPA: aldehyde dehydrogenase (NADP(+)) [Candidatus Angelobacter sp.]|nr:aldehyde dehydrogenase (NADP(+)) [Candidatus Angelobacter sp.]
MNLKGLSIIGQRRAKAAGNPNAALNPATGSAIGPDFFWATSGDVDEAAELASKAFVEFRRWPAKRRAALLQRIAELLEANAAAIIERANQETALPAPRLQGEMARTCFQLRFCGEAAINHLFTAARIDHGDPNRKPLPKPDLRSMMIPLGPVVVFSASNFPLAFSVAGGDTAAAFAAGCPAIVKPHHAHLGTSEMVGALIQQAAAESGAPDGIFSMLYGNGREIGTALVKHPRVKAVGFTGSRSGGRALMDAAAARPEPIPVYAEMGSINPVFVLNGALGQRGEEIAAGLHGSVTLGVGQFCTNPGLVFIEAGDAAKNFVAKLASLFTATAAGTMLTSGLCSAYQSGLEKFSKISGVKRVAIATNEGRAGQARAALFETNAKNFLNNPALMEEIFGPSTLLVECASRAEMLQAAARVEGQLTATIHALPDEVSSNRELVEALVNKAGRLLFGGFPTGVEVAHAMTHGGPYPATSDGRSTSVGTRAMERFLRPVSFQNFPDAMLPAELQESNPLGIPRLVDGKLTGC